MLLISIMRFGRKREGQEIDRSQFLSSYPVKNPVVITRSEEGGLVKLEVPMQKPSRWVSLLFSPPDKKIIKLDALGTFVWQRCDGAHTVQNIIDDISSQYKLTKAEAAVSLSEFMKDLAKKGLIAFIIAGTASGQSAGEKGVNEKAQGEKAEGGEAVSAGEGSGA